MNIKDIAALAETSVATVSRVINNEDNVSDETRKRVLEVIQTTGYKPNLVGRALRSQRSGKILVLIPAISHPFYSRVLQGVEHRASCRGYDTIVCITHRDPAVELRYLDLLKTRQVDGAIGFTAAMPEESLSKLSKEYPYVLCCARPRCRNISCVCIDHQAAAKDATEHFIRTGHTRIAFINCCSGRPFVRNTCSTPTTTSRTGMKPARFSWPWRSPLPPSSATATNWPPAPASICSNPAKCRARTWM